jgi:hypothetical protein
MNFTPEVARSSVELDRTESAPWLIGSGVLSALPHTVQLD